MIWLVAVVVGVVTYLAVFKPARRRKPNLKILPERFIVFDLETTGLEPETHEIIEIGAIRVHRDSDNHDSFRALVKPAKKIPVRITQITGITQDMIEREGEELEAVLIQFLDFIGDLPLVSFNAEFDMAFLHRAHHQVRPNDKLSNKVSCALKMARRAWPGRKSYRLIDLAKDGGLSDENTHRAIGDCKRTLIVYCAAASRIGSAS